MSSLITVFTSQAVGWPGSLRAALAGGGAPLSVLLLVLSLPVQRSRFLLSHPG